jgi:hypothetical protein
MTENNWIVIVVFLLLLIGAKLWGIYLHRKNNKLITLDGEGWFIYQIVPTQFPIIAPGGEVEWHGDIRYEWLTEFSLPKGETVFKNIKAFHDETLIFKRKEMAETIINSLKGSKLKIGYRKYDYTGNVFYAQY